MSPLTYFVVFCVALALGVSGAGNNRDIPEFRLLYPSENTILAPTDSIVFRWSALYTGEDFDKGKKIQISKEMGATEDCTSTVYETHNKSVFYSCHYHNADMVNWDSLNWWAAANNQFTVVTHFLHPPKVDKIDYEFAGLRPYVVVSFKDFGTAGSLLNKKNLILRLWTSKQNSPDFGTLMAEQEFDLDELTGSEEFLIVSDKKVEKNTMTHFIFEACVDTVCVSDRTDSAKSSLSVDPADGSLTVRYDKNENKFVLYGADSDTSCVVYFYSDLSEAPFIMNLKKGDTSIDIPAQYQYGSFYLRVVGVKSQEFFTSPTYVYKLLGTTNPGTPTLFTDGSDFIRSGDHLFQWDLSSWGTSSKESSYLFNVRLDVDGTNKFDMNTTSTFMNVGDKGVGKAKLTVTPIKTPKNDKETKGTPLTKEFTICDVNSFSKDIGEIVYNKDNDNTLSWSYGSDPKNFCNINGLWGFRVTLTTSSLYGSTEFIVTNSTKLIIPKSSLFYGAWNATVDLFIAGELISSSEPTPIINITEKGPVTKCGTGSPAFLNSFDVSRSKSSKTYPKAIELKWDYQELKSKCGLENVIVYMNDKPLAQIPTDIHGFTVPSYMLDPKITNNKFEVIIRSFYQGESTGRDVTTGSLNLTINDFNIVPPVILEKPSLGSQTQESKTKFEWKVPDNYPVSSKGFKYALFVGDSPDTMEQIEDATSDLSMEVSNDKIPFSGSTYWTVKIVNLKDGQETVAAPPLSFLRFSESNKNDPHIKVSFGDKDQPVVFSWDVNPFNVSFNPDEDNEISILGRFEITASCEDNSQPETITLNGYSSTASFYGLSSCTTGFKYTFKIIVKDDTKLTRSGQHTFLSSGGQIDLQMSCGTGIVVAPFTLSWTIPNNGWNCDCSTGSCKSHIFVSPSDGKSWRYIDTVPFDASLNGAYTYTIGMDQLQTSSSFKYAVVADNGYSLLSKTCVSDGGVCVPGKPLTPTIYYPEPVALNQPRNAKFCVVPLYDFNDCNASDNAGKYQLWIRDSATREMNIIDVDWSDIERNETGAICINHYVEFNIWDWTVAAVNDVNITSDVESFSIYDACEPLSPLKPIWNVSTTDFDFSPYHIPLSWTFPGGVQDDSVFGHYCMSDNGLHEQKTIYVYYSTEKTDFDDFDPSQFMYGGNVVTEHFRETGTISGVDIDHDSPLSKNTSFYFMVVVSNGARDTYSDVLDGRTREFDCEDLKCSSKGGICDKTGPFCSCYPDFEGDRCEIDLAAHRRMVIAISVSVSAFVVLVVAAIVVYLIVRRYYKTHKALMMKRPEFEALRTPPMKMPSFPPDLDVKIDYEIVERAVFGENGLVMIWDILKNTSATEIDAMAKALVYSFQKQNKALELMAFLIICEISESTSSTVLFRANSPATRAFKYYSKMYALEYLYKTLAVLLQGIIRDVDDMEEEDVEGGNATSMEDMNGDVEEDDDDISSDENIGFLKIQLMSQKFFVQINRSDKSCPGEIKHICACLQTQLAARYPDFVYQGIGAFVFLRFYNTAITVPESYGLLPEAPRPSVRKQLLAVTKVLQNLANGVLFGEKEQNMVKLNGFITSQRPAYEAFLGKLCDASAPLSEPVPISEESYKASLATIVNQLFVISRTDDTILDRIQGITDELRDHIRKMKASKKEQPQE